MNIISRSPKQIWNTQLFVTAMCVTVLGQAGCATTEIGRAQVLAKSGVQGAASLVGSASHTITAYDESRDLEGFQDALLGIPQAAASAAHQSVARQLQARRAVAEHLAETYSAFAALAGYDAQSEFDQSASGLFDAIDSAGQAAGASARTDRAIGSSLGGLLLAGRQAEKLRKASAAIRRGLEAYKKILDTTSPATLSIEREAVGAHFIAVQDLWKRGVLDGSSLISATSPEPGLALVSRPNGYTHSDPTADAVVSFTLIGMPLKWRPRIPPLPECPTAIAACKGHA